MDDLSQTVKYVNYSGFASGDSCGAWEPLNFEINEEKLFKIICFSYSGDIFTIKLFMVFTLSS